ncbi:MAG: hypothetical protein WC375_03725, partial [Methanomassiliicoccales archaeon]
MDLADIGSSAVVETTLAVCGLLALAIAVIGRKKETYLDEVLIAVGTIAGIFVLVVAVAASFWTDIEYDISTKIVLFLLGFGLFLKIVHDVKWASIFALLIGAGVGYALFWASETFELTDYITPTVVIIVALVIMLFVYLALKFFENLISVAGHLLSFRPIMFVIGLVAVAEAVLLL